MSKSYLSISLILQTLQQLKDVYGDSVDKIVQGNTSNIVFLKSTDDAMLDTLQKMSGTTHKSFTDSKSISRDMQKLMMQNEGKISYTMSTKEVPVISYNDMAFISERNSIIFRAGDAPIWNRNETILPMSWRLFKNTIIQPGKSYSLQTIPTLSTAKDFDIQQNQPDFYKMLDKRMAQAAKVKEAEKIYKEAYGYTDEKIAKLRAEDAYADEILQFIQILVNDETKVINAEKEKLKQKAEETRIIDADGIESMTDEQLKHNKEYTRKLEDDAKSYGSYDIRNASDDAEVKEELKRRAEYRQRLDAKIYARGNLSRSMFINNVGDVTDTAKQWDSEFIRVFKNYQGAFGNDHEHFILDGETLKGIDGKVYITKRNTHDIEADINALNESMQDEGSRTFGEERIDPNNLKAMGEYIVTKDFYKFLVSLDSWVDLADGYLESGIADCFNLH